MRRVDSDSDCDDEVVEVKRAMKEARARKKSLEYKLKSQLTRDSQEKSELEMIIKSLRQDLDSVKSELSSSKFDLKQAKFEIGQLQGKYSKLNEERKLMESVHKTQQLELQLKLESALKMNEEKGKLVSIEVEKLGRLAYKLFHDVSKETGKSQILRTHLHLLEKISLGISKVREINASADPSPSFEVRKALLVDENAKGSADATVDTALFDICRSMEEENVQLSEVVADLKNQLAEAKREAAASKLIPHYRLAVMRAKTHADNLTEQLQREKETSEELREQLNETYGDLKKVVEDKRKLYKRLGKAPLDDDEKLLRKGVQISISPKIGSRSSSPTASRLSRVKNSSRDGSVDAVRIEENLQRLVMENSLKDEVKELDSQIELIKEQLERAAALKSRKILGDVLDHGVQGSSIFS